MQDKANAALKYVSILAGFCSGASLIFARDGSH
jgi:hypothetical protein